MSNYLKEALKELNYLYEAKADIDAFKNKFGETNYNNFLKAKDRLKNKKLSTDIIYYTKNYSKEDLEKLILSLYDDKKDSQKKRMIKGEDKQIRGKYEYFGEFGNWKVYQPLDYISSMDLGVNTGWCTTGRYGHYGKPDFTPSNKDAREHFDDYTKDYGVKLYYFLNKNTMYGEYAIALYPEVIDAHSREVYDKTTKQAITLNEVNYELFNAQDNNIWYESDVIKIAKEKLKLELVLDIEETRQLDSCLEIENGVLVKCWEQSVREITIPNSVTTIGYRAFSDCSSLTNITIPNSVTTIGYRAFSNCSSLKDIYFTGTEEQWDKLVSSNNSTEISSSVNVHFNSKSNKISESHRNRRTTTRLVEAPDMFGIPTDDELDKEYQQDLDYLNKQRDSKREKTLSRRIKVQVLVNDIEDWIKNNKSNLLKVVTKLLNNPNILSLNTYKWENRVAKKTGHSSLSFYFRDKSSFEINRYIKINMLDGSYKFDFKVESNNFTSSNDPCYILTNLLEILNNLDVDSFIEEVINDNKDITNSEQNFIDRFISQPNRITSIKDCENGGHWAHGGKFFIFTIDNKYVYHFESYDSGAYSGDHTNTLRCFNEIDRKSNGNYGYDSQVAKKIDINNTGLEIENRRGQVNIVGGKIDIDKLISQSE